MRRLLLATLLVFHGLAHAAFGVWAAGSGPIALVSTLWGVATIGFLATGLAVLRTPVLRRYWRPIQFIATGSSVLLLILYGDGLIGLVGILIDLALLYVAQDLMRERIDRDIAAAHAGGVAGFAHPRWHRFGWGIGALALTYAVVVVAIRPIYLRWGTTIEERSAALPGDDRAPGARYRVDHAITIHAPADSVWPWLVQLGQDRGGFYSYSRLERLFGDRIENADRIHPEWQQLAVGDTIRATQPDYLGGRFGTLGWRVGDVVPGRAIILDNWGAFVLQPIDSATTRFIVRTRGPGTVSMMSFIFSPFSVFVFEPAHFIMQRAMLRGVRDRAEGRVRAS